MVRRVFRGDPHYVPSCKLTGGLGRARERVFRWEGGAVDCDDNLRDKGRHNGFKTNFGEWGSLFYSGKAYLD